MYENNHTTKPGKQPKVTSDNAMAIARSKSATDENSKAWDSRYVADAIVNVADDNDVSLTFITPQRAAHHVGNQFAPDITNAIGAQSMMYFNRYGATRLSFQKKGTRKGEVEEPYESVRTDGENFSFKLTGEEMKAAFTYINAKRQHTYSKNYNSATFASHVMKSAGISISANNAKSLQTAIEDEISREETNDEKKQWTLYSYVKGSKKDEEAKQGGMQLRAYELGYESQTSVGNKTRINKLEGNVPLNAKYALKDLHNKFTSSATLNSLLKQFEITKIESDAMDIFHYLFEKRHNGLEIQDVEDCKVFFEGTNFNEKLKLMHQLYMIGTGTTVNHIKYPGLDLKIKMIGNFTYIESAKELHKFLMLTRDIFGATQLHELIPNKAINDWVTNICNTIKINKLANPKESNIKMLIKKIDEYLFDLFNSVPLAIYKNTSREEMAHVLNIVRNAMENEFGKFSFYNSMKTDTKHFISKLYLGELQEVNYNQDADYETPILDQFKDKAQNMLNDKINERDDPNKNYDREMKDYYRSENDRVDADPHALSKYIQKKIYGVIIDIWSEAKFKSVFFTQVVSTAPYLNSLFSIVRDIDGVLPGFLSRIKIAVNENQNSYDPELLKAAGLGNLISKTETQG